MLCGPDFPIGTFAYVSDHRECALRVLPHCQVLVALLLDDTTVHPEIILRTPNLRHLHLVVPDDAPIHTLNELLERNDTALQSLTVYDCEPYRRAYDSIAARFAKIRIDYAYVGKPDPAAFMQQHSTVFRPPKLL